MGFAMTCDNLSGGVGGSLGSLPSASRKVAKNLRLRRYGVRPKKSLDSHQPPFHVSKRGSVARLPVSVAPLTAASFRANCPYLGPCFPALTNRVACGANL